MNATQQQIKALLEQVINSDQVQYELLPAPEASRQEFAARATASGVPPEVLAQLLDLYAVADGFSYEMTFGFFPCADIIIFEWWANQELWLSQRHNDTIRWASGKFCLGDASNASYSSLDKYDTLLELLAGCTRQIKEIEAASTD